MGDMSQPLSKKVPGSGEALWDSRAVPKTIPYASEKLTANSCKIQNKMLGSDLFTRRAPTRWPKDQQRKETEHKSQDLNWRHTNGEGVLHGMSSLSSSRYSVAGITKRL